MSRIEHCCKNLVANCFRNFFKEIKRTVRKCIEKIATIAKITNSNCKLQQIFLTDFCRNFSKNMFNRNCLQKKKNSAKIAKVTRNFIARKKTPRKLEYQQALALMSLPTIAEHHHNICTRTFESIMSDPNHKLRKLLPPPYKSNYNLRHARTFTLPRCKTNRFKNSFLWPQAEL